MLSAGQMIGRPLWEYFLDVSGRINLTTTTDLLSHLPYFPPLYLAACKKLSCAGFTLSCKG